ncbi:MAG: hypothetical protein QOI35_2927 [Cryptosporangiaceae bacterium]|nr:hypothetical protein [Cryptosporangiaceae bacterium]
MILETDKALLAMLRAEALGEAPVSVAFDAPNRPWIQAVKGVAINLYLFDIRENVQRRDVMYSEIRDEDGKVIERRPPVRRYNLYYNLTVWTPNVGLEHQVLACVVAGLGGHERIPEQYLPPALKDSGHVVLMELAQGMKRGMLQNIAGELKSSIEIAVTVPIHGKIPLPLAPPARQQPTLVVAGGGTAETAGGTGLTPEQKAIAQAAAMQRAAEAQAGRPAGAAPAGAAGGAAGATAAPAAGAPGAAPGAGAPAKPLTPEQAKAAQQAAMVAAAKQAAAAPPPAAAPAAGPAGQQRPGAPAAAGAQRPGQPQQAPNPLAMAQQALAAAAQAQAQLAQAQALLARALSGGARPPAAASAPASAPSVAAPSVPPGSAGVAPPASAPPSTPAPPDKPVADPPPAAPAPPKP